jgi:hypothetical protein
MDQQETLSKLESQGARSDDRAAREPIPAVNVWVREASAIIWVFRSPFSAERVVCARKCVPCTASKTPYVR